MFVVQSCQETLDILSLSIAHIEEGFLKVILHVNALHSEFEDQAVPTGLHSGEGLELDRDGVWQLLWQQVLHSKVFVLPIVDDLPLIIWDLGWVFGRGAEDGALKVGPPPGHLHRFTEVQDEYGPIGAISLEAGNVGGKELDGRNGHYQKNVAAVFIGLDLGRAHNL